MEEYFKQFREDLDMSKEDYGGMELEMAFWLWGKRVGFTTYVKDTKILLNKSQLRYDLIATGKLGAKLSCSFEFGDLQDVTLSGFVNGLYK